MKSKWLALLLVAAGGCDTTNNTIVQASPDLAGFPPVGCTPNAKECVNSTLARVCPADGSAWLAVQCQFGETCDQGDCGIDVTSVPCSPADNFCADDTNALICNDSGSGFHMKACPTNTHCVGGGDCAGSCVIGSGQCQDASTFIACNDGFTLTPTPCPSGEACSDVLGVCAPAACVPGSCSAVCGNKSLDPSNNDPAFLSFCSDGPLGFQWIAVPCTAPAACDPTAACNAVAFSDACVTECTPGSVRCVNALTGAVGGTSGQQACQPDGTWGSVTTCKVQEGKICITDANFLDLGCGDPICGGGSGGVKVDGYCLLDGGISKLRPCDATGNLNPIDRLTTCNPGACLTDDTSSTDPITGAKPGHCGTQCQMGDTRCDILFGQSIQGCAANGMWSTTTTLCVTPNNFCADGTNGAGRPQATCIPPPVCSPGQTRCTDMNGVVASTGDFIETCNALGQFGTQVACVGSRCGTNPNAAFPAKACFAVCIAGKTMCIDVNDLSPSPAPQAFGLSHQGTCTANGRPDPSPSPCPGVTSCRTGPNKTNAYGCVVCASVNEAGVPDTRCPTINSTTIEVCKNSNDGWTLQQTCPTPATCNDEDDPRIASPETCYLTESDLQKADPTDSCDLEGLGTPISCGGKPDCCSGFGMCQPASDAAPALCF